MEDNNWHIRKKAWGVRQVSITDKWEPAFRDAVKAMAISETERLGRKISVSTILTNLATRNGAFAIEKRKELRRTYKQLKKENINETRRERTSNT